ncbi:uncharacterized protein LOC131150607 [Malania oleifera]|uniref:uncharacterized protein LOC131150607 n=1 Tax=Malania oleifera TaxID=397392 RepID=UPI0025AE3C6B|nr:uncharacterized protein LOC131150607 [Malania oleifera]
MNALKEKVTNKVSRLFADSPSSAPSPTTLDSPPNSPPAKSNSQGGKSLSSFFSYISFDGFKSNKRQHDIKPIQSLPVGWRSQYIAVPDENLDEYVDCEPSFDNKEILNGHEEEGHAPGSSTSCSDMFEDAASPQTAEKAMSYLSDESTLISLDLYEFLQSSLPNIVKGCQWVLLYSTLKHGISLRTLIRKSADLSGPCLLVVGDMQGAVFGGLLECPLNPTSKRKYQGTNQTFVFTTIYGEPRLFRPTGANRYFYLCLNDLLALGGGGNFALCLDEDLLSGTSGPCETFGNLCLAHKPEFELKNLELWGFTHSSKYVA